MACTGIEYCKLAIVETKARGRQAGRRSWRSGCPTFDVPLTINVNGCPNSCARIQVADIGLKGQIVPDRGRQPGRGLPGAPRRRASASDAGFGRKLRGLKVTADELPDYVERVVRAYDERPRGGRDVRPLGGPGRRGGAAMTRGLDARGALLLPVLRRRRTCDRTDAARSLGVPRRAPASSPSGSSDWWSRHDGDGRTTSLSRAPGVPTQLERLATAAGRDLGGATAGEILQWAAAHVRHALRHDLVHGRRRAVPRRRQAIPGADVLFLDTGYHFPETLGTRDAVDAVYPVNVRTVSAGADRAEQDADYGRLYETDPDSCCASARCCRWSERCGTTTPGAAACAGTSRARPGEHTRGGWDARRGKVKVNPLARWTRRAGRRVRRRAWHPGQPAARDRLRLDRLRTLHPAGQGGRGRPCRPLGG